MPRQLTLVIEHKTFRTSPVKIDRRKLYGWTEIEATDDGGAPCEVVSADETGRLIIPRGGTAVGLLTPGGLWVERSELVTVTAEGKPAELLPSSFDTRIVLDKRVTPREYLDHDITDFYALEDAPEELIRLVGKDIYTFRYCYVAQCEGSPAFLLGSEGKLFLLIGRLLRFETVGYEEPQFIDEEPDEGDEAVDFAMFG